MKVIKENVDRIVVCLFEILAGILLLINPVGFTSGIIIALGIVLIVMGVMQGISYFKTEPEKAAMEQMLSKGFIEIGAGLFCVLRSNWFIATFPLLTILYGVIILLTGFIKIQWTVDMLRMKKSKWFLIGISAICSIVFATIILANPFSSTVFLWTFVAVSLIAEAILDIIVLIFSNKSGSKQK